MKAYVIKNKEGKYWRSKFDKKGNILFTDDIVDAMPYEEYDLIPVIDDCTIVPITICEGDLESVIKSIEKINDKLAEERYIFKKALELACEELLDVFCSDYCGSDKNCENYPYVVGRRMKDFIKLAQENLKAKESEKDVKNKR